MAKKMILCAFSIILIVLVSGCDDSGNYESSKISPRKEIENEIMKNDSNELTNAIWFGSGMKYTPGKVISASCDSEYEEDGYGRYIMRCKVVYNPKINGSTYTNKENTGDIYAAFMLHGNDYYYSRFRRGGSAYKDEFLKSICWGSSTSTDMSC